MAKKKLTVWIKTHKAPDATSYDGTRTWSMDDGQANGSMLDYVGYSSQDYGYEEREAFEFEATLHFADYYRGRSAAGFYLKGPQGERYVIRISELSKLLQSEATISGGYVKGRWGFVKQGANWSLTYLGA